MYHIDSRGSLFVLFYNTYTIVGKFTSIKKAFDYLLTTTFFGEELYAVLAFLHKNNQIIEVN